MLYRVWHKTTYRYGSSVALSHNQIRVHPRGTVYQSVLNSEIEIDPQPATRRMWADAFGNTAEFFSVEQSHELMSVTANSLVDRSPPPVIESIPAWRSMVSHCFGSRYSLDRLASQFSFDSQYAYSIPEVCQYATASTDSFDSLHDVTTNLMNRIHQDFKYQSASTTIDTSLADLMKQRQGVCQDFAHLMIACLRSVQIPARYVSGYILTHPPPGQPKLVGSDASHAWVSVYFGNGQWVDYDPTNNLLVGDEHITLAWGRDFADVSPVQGIFFGGGLTKLSVNVDVSRVDHH
jgi:transglutaminase-like putative cysteine protease